MTLFCCSKHQFSNGFGTQSHFNWLHFNGNIIIFRKFLGRKEVNQIKNLSSSRVLIQTDTRWFCWVEEKNMLSNQEYIYTLEMEWKNLIIFFKREKLTFLIIIIISFASYGRNNKLLWLTANHCIQNAP